VSDDLWLTSDLHFGHVNIIRYTHRPYPSVEAMNEGMIRAWNDVVRPSDTVWVLGDVCMGTLAETLPLVGRLHGTLHLLCGNHDRPFHGHSGSRQEWERRYRDVGFASIHHGVIELDIGMAAPVRACHFPYYGDSHDDDRFPDQRPIDDGRPLVHGHTHGAWRQHDLMVDVGVDAWGGVPVAASVVAELLTEGPADLDPLEWRSDAR
jgi:calcineurin-like phosphoesterase family protein